VQPDFSPSPGALRIPGRWPREYDTPRILDVVNGTAADDAPAPRGRAFMTTLGNWFLADHIINIMAVPARFIKRYFRQQQIIVQPVIRDDGACKKRIIDAGPVDEPATPTPVPRIPRIPRARPFRRGRGRPSRARLHSTIEPSEPAVLGLAPGPMEADITHTNTVPESRNVCLPSPILVEGRAALSKDQLARPDVQLAGPSSPNTWISSPVQAVSNLIRRLPTHANNSPSLHHDTVQEAQGDVKMQDGDDDLDFSFTDAWSSPVPKDRPADYLTTSGTPSPQPSGPAVPVTTNGLSGSQNASKIVPAAYQRVRRPEELSPSTHYNIIKKASVTPIRKQLIKTQVLAHKAFKIPTSPPADHTSPSRVSHTQKLSELQQKVYQDSVLKREAAVVALNAQKASEDYKTRAEAKKIATIPVPEISAAEQEHFNYVETIDQELSFLSDAPDYDEAAETSQSPSPHKKKSVRWETHAHAKTFYFDEEVANMIDSSLEAIKSSPYRTTVPDHYPQSDTSEEDAQDGSGLPSSPIKGRDSVQYDSPPKELHGFRGVPASTWEDSEDSIDESELSHELLEDLQNEYQKKMAVAPTRTPSPSQVPTVAALVTPLTAEEQKQLTAAATAAVAAEAKTGDELTKENWVVDQKLSARDFATLLPFHFNGDPRAWLNDNIVNEYLSIVVGAKKSEAGFKHKRGGAAPPLHAFSSFWYPTAQKALKGVERWAARFQLNGKQYLDADLVLYPICDLSHWRLLVVKPKERTIECLDSLGGLGEVYIKKLKEYLAKELGDDWVEEEWTVLKKQRSIRQRNSSDCGVFTILNALALLRGEEFSSVVPSDGMNDARERIAITLMAGGPTTEFD
jgi:hypothetical protein